MDRVQTSTGDFARRGFTAPSAAAATWHAWAEARGSEPPLKPADFDVAADPDQALDTVARLAKQQPALVDALAADPDWLRRVLLVSGGSDVLGRFLAKHPAEVEALKDEPRPRSAEQWQQFFDARIPQTDGAATGQTDDVRRANLAALTLVAARDLASEDPASIVESVSAELAGIADAVLKSALAFAHAEVTDWRGARFAIIAMGKTGAGELNYISDVDVIYVCEPAGETSVEEAMGIGTRLAAAVARICSAHTGEGTIWQVDPALRPEGKAGPLVRTLSSYRAYYDKWAENWEFQALLKARAVAGDLALGQEFCDMVDPLVWAAGQREGFLTQTRAMRQRVISLIPAKQANREIKLGPGGLRDTEFSVQLLQLVHGRGDERVRTRGTFDGLRRLVLAGYIGRIDGAEMESAYAFQRVLEHRVQLRRLRRTHLLPDDEPALRAVARSLRCTSDELVAKWRSSSRAVQRLQQRIFFSPLLDAVSVISTDSLRLTPEAAEDRLRSLGFADPRSALTHVQALSKGTSRSAEIQRQLLPAMLGWFAEGPNPDFGLLSFRQLSEALGSSSWYLRALRDEGYMAQRLARIASSSRYVVDLLGRAPEMVEMLASEEELRPRSAARLTEAIIRAVQRQDDPVRAAESLRAFRRKELCRIALADVLGQADLATVGQGLSDLAAASIDGALALARRGVEAPPVGIVALGRWGGSEIGYSSDADVMVVVPDDTTPEGTAAATALVRKVADILGKPGPDPALDLDTDLRPEGKGGAAVRSVSSYRAYYQKWAATWEAQAMLRARAGAGDLGLAQAVVDDLVHLRYPEAGLSHAQVMEIRKLKSRMEIERIPRGVSRDRHLKLGKGGLSDVEWTVQLLQLQHGHDHPELRTTSTLEALAALEGAGFVTDRQAADLRDAWLHASRLRNAIMLVRGRAADVLPTNHRETAAVAVLLGYEPQHSSSLADDTLRHMRHASRVVDELFWQA